LLHLKMNPYILIPTDFSDVCQNALIHGAELTRTTSGRLLILHVINKETKTYLARINKGPEYINVKLRNLADGINKDYGVQVEYLSRQGSIFKTISKVSKERDAKMMVMGTHGKNGIQHLVGSAAMRVISSVDIPVIVVQKRIFGEGFKKIILPLGLETDFLDKLDWVVEMANLYGSEIHIFQLESQDKKISNTMSDVGNLIASKLQMENIPYQIKTSDKEEKFTRDLLDYAIIQRADMIISTMENSNIEPFINPGNEEEKLIYNTSQIPVMCIHPG